MSSIAHLKLTFSDRGRRWLRAWRYARGHLTPAEAAEIEHDCHATCGAWPLQCIDAYRLAEVARARYGEHEHLDRLAHHAAATVAQRWQSDPDLAAAAEDWGLDLIHRFAADGGIILEEKTDTA